MSVRYDYLVAGAGVVGLATAWEIKKQFPGRSVGVVEKEAELGCHASGRNSGVLHAGLYYPPGTLKAQLCVDGAKLLATFCVEEKLPFKAIGKVILPLRNEDDAQIDFLIDRARANGVSVELIDQKRLKEIEPAAQSLSGRALYSPATAIFEPLSVLHKFRQKAEEAGVKFHFGETIQAINDQEKCLHTHSEKYAYGQFVNAAGAYADRLAHLCEVDSRYVLMPFKGLYFKLKKNLPFKIRGLVYPVPDLRVPFLGVHFTPSFDGRLSIGPSALPALGPENYGWIEGIEWSSLIASTYRLARQYLRNQAGFRLFAHQEIHRLSKRELARVAQALIPQVRAEHIEGLSKVGIRAQLYDTARHQLEMDFVVKRGLHSVHILNAVSPGFTSSLSFAKYIIREFIS
jgi:L-2-hydroxyglutarate oxidase LhgO